MTKDQFNSLSQSELIELYNEFEAFGAGESEIKPKTEAELEEMFRDYLNETHGDVDICGHSYASWFALKEIDNDAYEYDYACWRDSHDYINLPNGDYLTQGEIDFLQEWKDVVLEDEEMLKDMAYEEN